MSALYIEAQDGLLHFYTFDPIGRKTLLGEALLGQVLKIEDNKVTSICESPALKISIENYDFDDVETSNGYKSVKVEVTDGFLLLTVYRYGINTSFKEETLYSVALDESINNEFRALSIRYNRIELTPRFLDFLDKYTNHTQGGNSATENTQV